MARGKMYDELERFGTVAPLGSTQVANLATGTHAALGAAFHLGSVGFARWGRRRSAADGDHPRTKPAV